MQVEILGTESLGVRGMCCAVNTRLYHIVIDPGIALGFRRQGLLPHPRQIAAGVAVSRRIAWHLSRATDVVFSHYHGDHIPLANANPYQLLLSEIAPLLAGPRLWGKSVEDESGQFAARAFDLASAAGQPIGHGPGRGLEGFEFSESMPHGARDSGPGTVMMTRIEEDGEVFVHASDIQLLDDEPIGVILDWKPSLLILSGPPIYRALAAGQIDAARQRAVKLVREVPCCIIDHHLLRCRDGLTWLDRLQAEAKGVVQCAADYMGVPRSLLEADRLMLYDFYPVPKGWHEGYQRVPLKYDTSENFHFQLGAGL